jgi:hypothetical protein
MSVVWHLPGGSGKYFNNAQQKLRVKGMNSAPLRIQLSWDDPVTGDRREPMLVSPLP